jgi:NOL1/NOP2/sun family putative RNA methylase
LKTIIFPETPESVSIAKEFRYDTWLVDRFLHYVPDVDSFVRKMELPPSRYIRANTLKVKNSNELKLSLARKGFVLERTPMLYDVFRVGKEPGDLSLGATTEYMLGLYYIQDLSSCLAVDALDPKPHERILDVAAAPGGKTTFAAQKMENTGAIVAIEPNPKRARSLWFNLTRMGVLNACICRIDGAEVSSSSFLKSRQFDKVLLDAPCSCEGVIAKDPTRKTDHTPKDVEYCSNRQQDLISAAIKMVRPGGTLVYSTCSFAPEENEMVVNSLLQKRSDYEITIEPFEFGSPGLTEFGGVELDRSLKNTRRFYPHIHDTTGFFIAKLRVNN